MVNSGAPEGKMTQISIFHLVDVNLMRYNGCIIFFSPWNRQRRTIKKKLYYKRDDFTFPIFNFSFIKVKITFDHLYVILEFVLSTVIVWAAYTEADQPRLRYSHVEVVASNILQLSWQPVDHYEIFISHITMDLLLLRWFIFFSLSLPRTMNTSGKVYFFTKYILEAVLTINEEVNDVC